MMEHKFEIRYLEVKYVPTEVGYTDGKECYARAPIGTHSIECKYMPPELVARIKEFIINVENAHR